MAESEEEMSDSIGCKLKIGYLNIRGIYNKMETLTRIINENKFDVFGVGETQLYNKSIEDEEINTNIEIEDYECFRNSGGYLALYYNKKSMANFRRYYYYGDGLKNMNEELETLGIGPRKVYKENEVQMIDSKTGEVKDNPMQYLYYLNGPMLIIIVYFKSKTPDISLSLFFKDIKDEMDKNCIKYVYILGDFNINLHKEDNKTKNLTSLVREYNLHQLVSTGEFTRELEKVLIDSIYGKFVHTERSLLDHIYTNCKEKASPGQVKRVDKATSDHSIIYCIHHEIKF